MTPDLKPLTGVVTFKVEDPKGNVIYLKPNVILTKGVAMDNLTLTKLAIEGEYTISVEHKVRKSEI